MLTLLRVLALMALVAVAVFLYGMTRLRRLLGEMFVWGEAEEQRVLREARRVKRELRHPVPSEARMRCEACRRAVPASSLVARGPHQLMVCEACARQIPEGR